MKKLVTKRKRPNTIEAYACNCVTVCYGCMDTCNSSYCSCDSSINQPFNNTAYDQTGDTSTSTKADFASPEWTYSK